MSLFQTRKPRQFFHSPIYWNSLKEKQKESLNRIAKENSVEDAKENIKGKFLNASVHLNRNHRRKVIEKSFYRGLIFSLVVLAFSLLYFIYFN
ncbi:MAG: hypothetical protein LUG18_15580 [Candidatus Azobacteroides sp.]|nr:hypothetical protein [Candidatus Azobacteroides sp.]